MGRLGMGFSKRGLVYYFFKSSTRRHYYAFMSLAITLINDHKVRKIRILRGLINR